MTPTPPTRQGYLAGLLLSLILTAAAFALVMSGIPLDAGWRVGALVVLALIQMGVQAHYFLHLGTASGQAWNLMALIYTLLIVALIVGGSLWIMHSTQMHMMADMVAP